MSQKPEENFDIYGYIKADGLVLSTSFEQYQGKLCSLIVLSNNLVEKHELPSGKYENRLEPMPEEATNPAVRKIDRGSNMIVGNVYIKKHYVLGKDNYLKEYEHFPSDKFSKVNWNMPPVPPGKELPSHALMTTCLCYGGSGEQLVSGGKDGKVLIRNFNDNDSMERPAQIQAHSVVSGGVSAIGINRSGTYVYTAGCDGSISINSIGRG